ncbi:hypothetical protein B0H63DRAFT_529571 [Podospora didyma]|uniref:Uncharacterized protein n=1 Tax=Podospora didyma TaxID=330526 RepID=A0AAE0K1V3_9PEZI|nr:hypothetical protein B0H63DRAFT_529571 [Podospora didyma]
MSDTLLVTMAASPGFCVFGRTWNIPPQRGAALLQGPCRVADCQIRFSEFVGSIFKEAVVPSFVVNGSILPSSSTSKLAGQRPRTPGTQDLVHDAAVPLLHVRSKKQDAETDQAFPPPPISFPTMKLFQQFKPANESAQKKLPRFGDLSAYGVEGVGESELWELEALFLCRSLEETHTGPTSRTAIFH